MDYTNDTSTGLTIIGLLSVLVSLLASANYIKTVEWRVATSLSIWLSSFGFLAYLFGAEEPFDWQVCFALGLIPAAITFGYGFSTIPAGKVQIFQPTIRGGHVKVLNVSEWRILSPGVRMVWNMIESLLAEVTVGKIILDGADQNTVDASSGATGKVEVRFANGTGIVPFRLEVAPFTEADTPETLAAFEKFVRTIESNTPLSSHESRVRLIKGRAQALVSQAFEGIAKGVSVYEATASSTQEDLEAIPSGRRISPLQMVRDNLVNQFGLDPSTFVLQVGDITFSDEAKKALATRTENELAGSVAESFMTKLAPKKPEVFFAELLAEQGVLITELKAATPTDLAAIKAKLLEKQRAVAKGRKAVLRARRDALPKTVDEFKNTLGNRVFVKAISDFAANLAELKGQIALATQEEKADELVGPFAEQYAVVKDKEDAAVKRLKGLEAAMAATPPRLASEFQVRQTAYEADLAKLRTMAYQLASAGVLDIDYIATSGLASGNGGSSDGTATLRAALEAIEVLGNRKGGGK